MSDIKELQLSLHAHIIEAIEPLQVMKLRLEVEIKHNKLEEYQVQVLKQDLREIDVIIEKIIGLKIMQEFFQTSRDLFHS